MSKNLFITGTGTDVGKTYVTGLVIKKLKDSGENAAYYKAAMSGNKRRADGSLIPGDALSVKEVSGITQPLEEMCPYIYENAYSPHLAARIEGEQVELSVVEEGFRRVSGAYDYVTVEGSGGILCPIRFDGERILLEDVIKALHLSCLLVADAGLGTINNVVLTTEYMRARDIPIVGMIFNRFHPGDVMEEDNIRMCEELTGLKTLACVREGDRELSMEAEVLKSLYC
ncbi:MAG: dethiobiotin synthase [Lachnospiraceae bacterium]|nr:dethiobiotin synthase [Lachnospiraceae bacterium]